MLHAEHVKSELTLGHTLQRREVCNNFTLIHNEDTVGKSDHSSNDRSVHRELLGSALKKVDFAGNITVVKTLAGMAQGIGAAIDSMHLDGIVGSVAGDDTLIIIARSEAAAEALKNDIEKLG